MKITYQISISIAVLLIFSVSAYSQDNPTGLTKFSIAKINDFNPSQVTPSFNPRITSLEAPIPGGESYRAAMMKKRNEVRKKYPLKKSNIKW